MTDLFVAFAFDTEDRFGFDNCVLGAVDVPTSATAIENLQLMVAQVTGHSGVTVVSWAALPAADEQHD